MKKDRKPGRGLNWKLWTGLIVSAIFTYLALKQVDLGKTWEVIQSANLFHLSLVVVLTYLQYVVRTLRWAIFLEPVRETGFASRLHSLIIGFAANCVLPARLGEFIRANCLANSEKMSGSSAFATIVVERLFDGFTLLLVLLIGVLGTVFPQQWRSVSQSLRTTGFFLLLFYVLVIVFLVGFKVKTQFFSRLLEKILFFLPHRLRSKSAQMLLNFSQGLVPLKGPSRWIQAVLYSFLVWSIGVYQIDLVGRSVNLDLPLIAPFVIMAMASFGVMIPSAPGFIGTFHLSAQYGFMFYGIGREEALSAAILWHAAVVFPTILFGAVSLLLYHASFGDFSREPAALRGARHVPPASQSR